MRELWATRSGFVLASIGSAVGIGNIWRFAYVAGENGGGTFLLVYVLIAAGFGVPLLIAELALGKRGASDGVTAYAAVTSTPAWRHAGWPAVIGAVVVLGFYSVVAGWALRYFAASMSGALWADATEGFGASFARFIANPVEPLLWQAAMLVLAVLVVAAGVRRGLERVNVVVMPLLALTVLGLAGYALTLPGSSAGVAFLLAPDWSAATEPRVLLAALGQVFFSVGVGIGVFVTFGGYMRSGFPIPASAAVIVLGDTLFAVVAGLAIFPSVFALGADPASGPELAFVTLPQVFLSMPGGLVVGPVFFLLLAAAALTSMISVLEVPIAVAVHRLGVGRRWAAPGLGAIALLIGLPAALSYGVLDEVTIAAMPILDAMDFAVSNLLLPLCGLLPAALIAWHLGGREALRLVEAGSGVLGLALLWSLRIAPVLIVLVIARRLS